MGEELAHPECRSRTAGTQEFPVGKPEEKRLLARPRYRWTCSETNFSEKECGGMDWLHDKKQWRDVVSTVMNLLLHGLTAHVLGCAEGL
jgi:hypothetical protein